MAAHGDNTATVCVCVCVCVKVALNLEDGGQEGVDSHAPISTQLQTPSALAFVVAGCM